MRTQFSNLFKVSGFTILLAIITLVINPAGAHGQQSNCPAPNLQQFCILFIGNGTIGDMAFSPNGEVLALVSRNLNLTVLSIPDGAIVAQFVGSGGFGEDLEFSVDGRQIILGRGDGSVLIWNWRSGSASSFQAHERAVTSVALSPDGLRIATGALDRIIKVWDAASFGLIAEVQDNNFPFLGAIADLKYSTDGQWLASASGHGTKVWNAENLELIDRVQTTQMNGVSFSRDGAFLASTGLNVDVPIWEIAAGSFNLATTIQTQMPPDDLGTDGVSFSADGRSMAVGEFYNTVDTASVRIWDLNSVSVMRELRGVGESIFDVNFSENGKFIAANSEKGLRSDYVLLWQIEN